MSKIKLGAVIPTVQYGNLQPEFEYDTEDLEWATADAERRIQALWDKYGEKPLVVKGGERKLLQAFVGGEIYYDEAAHVYTNQAGEVYLSGSQYAKQFEKPFDTVKISQAMAKKLGKPELATKIVDMWELKSSISMGLGTAIHAALELYGRFDGLAKQLERTTNLHDHPVVKKAVESFYGGRSEQAEYEALIVDHKNKRAGRVDRLVILGDKHCRIEDYKCNAEMTPEKLTLYWHQLDFYGEIMLANDWKVEPPVIHHWDGEWHVYDRRSS